MHKQGLALNSFQRLICLKTQPIHLFDDNRFGLIGFYGI